MQCCPYVCARVCEQNISKSYERILTKFCGKVERGQEKSIKDFCGYPDSFVAPGSFSRIFGVLSIRRISIRRIPIIGLGLGLGIGFSELKFGELKRNRIFTVSRWA